MALVLASSFVRQDTRGSRRVATYSAIPRLPKHYLGSGAKRGYGPEKTPNESDWGRAFSLEKLIHIAVVLLKNLNTD